MGYASRQKNTSRKRTISAPLCMMSYQGFDYDKISKSSLSLLNDLIPHSHAARLAKNKNLAESTFVG